MVCKMDEKAIVKLLEKASDTEWKYLLKIQVYLYDSYEILHGDADFITIDNEDEDYIEKIVVPRTVPVILRHRHKTEETIYIFTKDGWKSVIT